MMERLLLKNSIRLLVSGYLYDTDLASRKDEWEKFFWTVISTIEQGTATPLDVNRHKTEIEELVVRLTTPATTEQIQEFHALIKGEQK